MREEEARHCSLLRRERISKPAGLLRGSSPKIGRSLAHFLNQIANPSQLILEKFLMNPRGTTVSGRSNVRPLPGNRKREACGVRRLQRSFGWEHAAAGVALDLAKSRAALKRAHSMCWRERFHPGNRPTPPHSVPCCARGGRTPTMSPHPETRAAAKLQIERVRRNWKGSATLPAG